MPADDGLRLHDEKRPLPAGSALPQDNPEQPVRCGETRLRMPGFQGCELLSQGEIFEEKIAAGTEKLNG